MILINYDQACEHLKTKLKTPRDQAALRVITQAAGVSLAKPNQALKRELEQIKSMVKHTLLAQGSLTLQNWQEILKCTKEETTSETKS